MDVEITRESIWRCADGHLVAVKDMTDSHLLNIIRCFRQMSPHGTQVAPRRGPGRHKWLNALANEAYARGLELDPLTDGEPEHE